MKRFVVVYQFGKVASTSIVASMNELPDVFAKQSHFLGQDALSTIVPAIVSAETSPYFFKHQFGQFVSNTHITRRINLIRAGKLDERLLILSLTRRPLDWARSSIVQDLRGYLPVLRNYCRAFDIRSGNDGDMVCSALTHLIGCGGEILAARGGIDAALAIPTDRLFHGSALAPHREAQQLLKVILRPCNWFENHYEPALGMHPRRFEKSGYGLFLKTKTADFANIRFEDIATALPDMARDLGLADDFQLKRHENASATKLFADDVARAFASPAATAMASLLSATDYARLFGYTEADQSRTGSEHHRIPA